MTFFIFIRLGWLHKLSMLKMTDEGPLFPERQRRELVDFFAFHECFLPSPRVRQLTFPPGSVSILFFLFLLKTQVLQHAHLFTFSFFSLDWTTPARALFLFSLVAEP